MSGTAGWRNGRELSASDSGIQAGKIEKPRRAVFTGSATNSSAARQRAQPIERRCTALMHAHRFYAKAAPKRKTPENARRG